jgi:hypothetical protein
VRLKVRLREADVDEHGIADCRAAQQLCIPVLLYSSIDTSLQQQQEEPGAARSRQQPALLPHIRDGLLRLACAGLLITASSKLLCIFV